MPDVLTKKQRSYCMSRIKGRNTGPEIRLKKALWESGTRYRIRSALYGRPDIVFIGKKVAVFVDGCFWHGCQDHYMQPKTRNDFWKKKIEKNRTRDSVVNERLREEGWTVLRFWEHEVDKNLLGCVAKIAETLGRPLPRIGRH